MENIIISNIFNIIISFLKQKDIISLSKTNKIIRNILLETEINNYNIINISDINNLFFLANNKTIKINNLIVDCNINLSEVHITNILRCITKLKKLVLYSYNISKYSIIYINKLEYLTLYKVEQIDDYTLKLISSISTLKSLYLYNCSDITDVGLNYLSNLSNIKLLFINNIKNITDDSIKILNNLKNLEVLSISFPQKLTEIGYKTIGNLSKLHTICLFGVDNVDLSIFSNIKHIELLYCNFKNDNYIIDNNKFKNLLILSLKGSDILNFFDKIIFLTNIQTLDLSFCTKQITNESLSYLKPLNKLKHLFLQNCTKISDSGLITLSTLIILETLDLSYCNLITNEGIYYISSLIKLEKLILSRCYNLTYKCIPYLNKLPRLQILKLDNCKIVFENLTLLKCKNVKI